MNNNGIFTLSKAIKQSIMPTNFMSNLFFRYDYVSKDLDKVKMMGNYCITPYSKFKNSQNSNVTNGFFANISDGIIDFGINVLLALLVELSAVFMTVWNLILAISLTLISIGGYLAYPVVQFFMQERTKNDAKEFFATTVDKFFVSSLNSFKFAFQALLLPIIEDLAFVTRIGATIEMILTVGKFNWLS